MYLRAQFWTYGLARPTLPLSNSPETPPSSSPPISKGPPTALSRELLPNSQGTLFLYSLGNVFFQSPRDPLSNPRGTLFFEFPRECFFLNFTAHFSQIFNSPGNTFFFNSLGNIFFRYSLRNIHFNTLGTLYRISEGHNTVVHNRQAITEFTYMHVQLQSRNFQ